MAPSKTFVYKQLPKGAPVAGQDIITETREIDIETPPKGGLILEVFEASLDPYMRGMMRSPEVQSYRPPYQPEQAIPNATVSKVLKSDNPDFKEGDFVYGNTPIAEYARIEKPSDHSIIKINNSSNLDFGQFLGPLGMPGLTAWSGLYEIGKPKKGETIFISSAAGAVGQVVGQVAKHEGLKVIGSVGSDEKLDFITKELGFDAGFNYKKESPAEALPRLAPQGIDIYFENVGGDHLEAALNNMNVDGRIAACGMISSYNLAPEDRYPIRNLGVFISKRLTMQGFLVRTPNFGPKYFKEHQETLSKWLADGSVKSKLAVTEGIDNAAQALVGMLQGDNFGKAVLKIK